MPEWCIVFDVDDTLYLERDYVRSGFEAVDAHLVQAGVHGFFSRAWGAFERGVRGNTFDVILQEILNEEPSKRLIDELVAIYRSHPPRIQLSPDARVALDLLSPEYPLGVITDGPSESQRAKIYALGLSAHIDLSIVTAELGTSKPDPKPFEILRDTVTDFAAADSFVYVADNPKKDFEAPRRLAWRTVRVRRGSSLHANLPSGTDVDVEGEDLSDFPELLSNLA